MSQIGEPGKIISSDIVFEEAVREESVNGDGGITLGWNSTEGGGIAAGETYGGCVLLQPYLPSRNSDGSYRLTALIRHRSLKLSRPFMDVAAKVNIIF